MRTGTIPLISDNNGFFFPYKVKRGWGRKKQDIIPLQGVSRRTERNVERKKKRKISMTRISRDLGRGPFEKRKEKKG